MDFILDACVHDKIFNPWNLMQEIFSVYPTNARFFKNEKVLQLQLYLLSATRTMLNS